MVYVNNKVKYLPIAAFIIVVVGLFMVDRVEGFSIEKIEYYIVVVMGIFAFSSFLLMYRLYKVAKKNELKKFGEAYNLLGRYRILPRIYYRTLTSILLDILNNDENDLFQDIIHKELFESYQHRRIFLILINSYLLGNHDESLQNYISLNQLQVKRNQETSKELFVKISKYLLFDNNMSIDEFISQLCSVEELNNRLLNLINKCSNIKNEREG